MDIHANPQWMTFDQRMKEVASILAAAILRRKRRDISRTQKESQFSGFGLDVYPEKSVHSDNPLPKGEKR